MATDAAFTGDGSYRTGDLGRWDAAGNLHLEGRLKELIVLPNGLNVHPEDVEAELRKEPAIGDCVVLALPNARGESEVHAAVIPAGPQDDGTRPTDAIADAVRRAGSRLSAHQRVSGFSIWKEREFPRTRLLKVKRHEEVLRTLTSAGGVSRPVAETAAPPGDTLGSLLARVTGRPVTEEADLELDLGLDSLRRVEVAMLLEEELGKTIDEETLAELTTVADLRRALDEPGAAGEAPRFARWPTSRAATNCRRLLHRAVVVPVQGAFCRPFSVEGLERLRDVEPPVVFIANHSSHFDTLSVLRALPPSFRERTAVAAAADYFYERAGVGHVMSLLLNTFPFSREGHVRPTLEYCGQLVDEGWSLLVFPEGTRSPTGRLLPFRPGLRLLARDLRIPVVPIALTGTHDALPKGKRWPRRAPVRVCFGRPIGPPATERESELRVYEEVMAALLEDCQRGCRTMTSPEASA